MPNGAADLGFQPVGGKRRQGFKPLSWVVAALVGLLIAVAPAAAQQATGAAPDFESEPDLAGLLAATKGMRMTRIEPGLSAGAAEFPAFGLRIHVFDFARDRFTLRVGEQKAETGNRAPEFFAGNDDVRANVVAQACAVASGSRQVSLWLI